MNIVIAGDSWAYTWLTPEGHGPNPGIERLLINQGHLVSTVAVPGGSNRESIARIRPALDAFTVDRVIWIQTDPIRDFFTKTWVPQGPATRQVLDVDLFVKQAHAHRGIEAAQRHHLRTETYPNLQALAEQSGVSVLVVGGCSQVIAADLKPFSNLIAAVPSWVNCLIPKVDCLTSDTAQWLSHEYSDYIMALGDVDLIRDWYAVTQKTMNKTTAWLHDTRYFNPDSYHPNMDGHRVLVDLLAPWLTGKDS